ncbi:MAG: peptidyl-alpha-hydroxyglycine alpha-amidating lyase family protein [Limnochordia bacterium]|jgi:DNA-binding beta-propeller fold protein YncE
MEVGSGDFRYESVSDWAQLPEGWDFVEVSGVGVDDAKDRVYVFNRGEEPIIIFNREGRFIGTWEKDMFKRPHGICFGPDDTAYCVDDMGHALHKRTTDGKLLMLIETADNPADTGYVPGNFASVRRAGPPFHQPTNVALSPEGDIYVSDGYGNARIHKFNPKGELILSWGEPGGGPGQFFLPHGVYVDKGGLVYVSDRENKRVQIFEPDGTFVTQWSDVRRPNQLCQDKDGYFYVAELGFLFQQGGPNPGFHRPLSRITVRDKLGRILAEIVEEDPYWAPHGLAIDEDGNLYAGSVSVSFTKGTAPKGTVVMRKYVRK